MLLSRPMSKKWTINLATTESSCNKVSCLNQVDLSEFDEVRGYMDPTF